MNSKVTLTPQEEALAQALDDFRWKAGPTSAAGILGMAKETYRSLCYRRRRPSAPMAWYLAERCADILNQPNFPRDGLPIIERILAAARALQQ